MKIDYTKLEMKHWFEDENGTILYGNTDEWCTDEWRNGKLINEQHGTKQIYYRRCFPLEFHNQVDGYCYHPKNPIIKFLCNHSNIFYNIVAKGKNRTFKPLYDGVTSYGSTFGQECIVAMVNSGDFTLEQAIFVYANSCERCMNSLLYKYLDGKDGYQEYSKEWEKCGTVCDFCKPEPTFLSGVPVDPSISGVKN